ncbi:MAG: exodeoxyribonuclease VII large subunit [Bacteroidales bacterium]|nr:exodeoxyribonuclease VII large subunit [Bacteroidales bacterium]
MERDFLELLELQTLIREGIEESVPGPVRVKAEIASLQHKANGHCYLELCESGPRGPVAKVRAVIWRNIFESLSRKFIEASGGPLAPGMSLIFEVTVNYSELYGLSLTVEDIDVEHTLGEAELLRRQTIERLETEGLMELQKELALPSVPYSLAIISAEDAAGYGDFRRHLLQNDYGFAFDVRLFPATMQGDTAPASIAAALNRIEDIQNEFDGVFIMRGGGSVLDLACFDDYDLCAAIARFPLPVYTAIGHDRDVHVADMVACGSVKTPTALADLCIDAVAAEDERISSLESRLRLAFLAKIAVAEANVAALAARIAASDPRNILSRGYALVTDSAGRVLKSAAPVNVGDALQILYSDGKLNCTVDGKV